MTEQEQQIDILRQRMSEKEIETKLNEQQIDILTQRMSEIETKLEDVNSIIVSNFKESNFITEKKHVKKN